MYLLFREKYMFLYICDWYCDLHYNMPHNRLKLFPKLLHDFFAPLRFDFVRKCPVAWIH